MATKTKKGTNEVKTTECPITRAEFEQHGAAGLEVTIADKSLIAARKDFSTGSLGWFAGGTEKITLTVNGKPVKVQVSLSLVIVGSKDLPQ
jgi:hypothetical protein